MDAILHYHRRRKIALIALGNQCANCGATKELEFDHIDPTTKEIVLSKQWYHIDWWDEVLDKCQILCHSCHLAKSGRETAVRKQKDRSLCHGTISQYYRYKCRCEACRTAYSTWRKGNRLKRSNPG